MLFVGKGFAEVHRRKKAPIVMWSIVIVLNILIYSGRPWDLWGSLLWSVGFIFTFSFVYGCIVMKRELPFINLRQKYTEVFETLKFKSLKEEYPFLIGEEENEFLIVHGFKTQIPINEWLNKKALIETHINQKIMKIEVDEKNNNIVLMYIAKKDLPSNILWDGLWGIGEDVLNLGVSHLGRVSIDLSKQPHIFIAGETGAGKSVLMKGLIYQSLCKRHSVKLIDFKRGVSFYHFDGYITIHSEYEEIATLLESLVVLTNKRYDLFRRCRVEDINEYNALEIRELKRVVVFIDELAELVKTSDKEMGKRILTSLESLTRISRGAGINLIMGLQRPDSTIINGQIKNNVTCRICGRFIDPEPSRIMLGNDLASNLPNVKGRFIIKENDYTEFQAYRFTNETMNMDYIFPQSHEDEQEQPQPKAEPAEPMEQPQSPEPTETVAGIDFNFDGIEI